MQLWISHRERPYALVLGTLIDPLHMDEEVGIAPLHAILAWPAAWISLTTPSHRSRSIDSLSPISFRLSNLFFRFRLWLIIIFIIRGHPHLFWFLDRNKLRYLNLLRRSCSSNNRRLDCFFVLLSRRIGPWFIDLDPSILLRSFLKCWCHIRLRSSGP